MPRVGSCARPGEPQRWDGGGGVVLLPGARAERDGRWGTRLPAAALQVPRCFPALCGTHAAGVPFPTRPGCPQGNRG